MLSSKEYKLKADEYAFLMKSSFEQSQLAWKNGDKSKAKEMSLKGNEYKALLSEANKNFMKFSKLEKEENRNTDNKAKVISSLIKESIKKDKIYETIDACKIQDMSNNLHEEEFNINYEKEIEYHRNQALINGEKMSESFEESRLSWTNGDKAKAKKFSELGHEFKKQMELHNSLALELIIKKNNSKKNSDEIDLHGLYENDAIEYFKEMVNNKMNCGDFISMRVIVGKGNHSKDKPKLKLAIANFANLKQFQVFEDPENEGCLIILK